MNDAFVNGIPRRTLFDSFPELQQSSSNIPRDKQAEEPAIAAMQASQQALTRALVKIVQERAWEKRGYPSIKAFWKAEIPCIDYSTLIRLKNAIAAHARLEPGVEYGILPEYVYRALLKIDADAQPQVWTRAKRFAGGLEKLRPRHIEKALKALGLAQEASPEPAVAKAGMKYEAAVAYLARRTIEVFGSPEFLHEKTVRRLFEAVISRVMGSVRC